MGLQQQQTQQHLSYSNVDTNWTKCFKKIRLLPLSLSLSLSLSRSLSLSLSLLPQIQKVSHSSRKPQTLRREARLLLPSDLLRLVRFRLQRACGFFSESLAVDISSTEFGRTERDTQEEEGLVVVRVLAMFYWSFGGPGCAAIKFGKGGRQKQGRGIQY